MIENFTNNKPVKEVTYLNTENSQRYRTIIQIMFKKYEQMKFWIFKSIYIFNYFINFLF